MREQGAEAVCASPFVDRDAEIAVRQLTGGSVQRRNRSFVRMFLEEHCGRRMSRTISVAARGKNVVHHPMRSEN